ncbi:ATV_HP_G0154510.mRNA.1.CDS.1 [Saccharomyces cerevisiae]|nr:ATV_HP_G0154510.mRNA.1.CDS.1 [Saccharomyces cerevisiae]CAI6933226.1 ATV_HP_G0154510.mRNA.1.CDS.1 [Saccharomyces cerevisiae]
MYKSCVKERYPPTMIHKAFTGTGVQACFNKPAKLQALEAIKLLVSKQNYSNSKGEDESQSAISEPSRQPELIEKISELDSFIA